LAIDDFDSDSEGDQEIPIRGKRFNIYELPESIARILRAYGSLQDCRELIPAEIQSADLRAENIICVRQFKKGKYARDVYPTSLSGLRAFKVARGGGGSKTPSQASIMNAASSSAQLTTTEAVNITTPKNQSIVVRGKYGVLTDGSASVAKSVKLDWGSGGDTVAVDNEYWHLNNLPLAPDEYTLLATVAGDDSSTTFTVELKPAIVGYTAEEIQAVMNDRPGHPQQEPTKSGYIAADAGLLTQDEPLVKNGVHIDEVKALASNATGDFNLFYSWSGDQAFIDKRISFIFGINLSAETKQTLVDELLTNKKPGFMDATDAYHEAMNVTLNKYFAEHSYGKMISDMGSPEFYLDPLGFVVMEGMQAIVQVKLNAHLYLESNGAPALMRKDARFAVFEFVAMNVVGLGVGSIVLKAASRGFKVTKSYFGKHTHKFIKPISSKSPSGLHNQKWDDVATKDESFKTVKPVDMDNLSTADATARQNIKRQGRSGRDAKQLLSSGDDFTTKKLKSGDKLYGFDSMSNKYGAKNKQSMYWLDEAGYQDIKSKYYKDGVWNKEGVKNHLSLPCMNRADVIDVVEVTESHKAIESTVGVAREQVAYSKDNYTTGMMGKIMPGGGKQITPDSNKISSVIRLKGTP